MKNQTSIIKKVLFTFLLFSPLFFSAQSELDSLLKIDLSKLTAKKRVETTIYTSRAYYEANDLEKGVEFGKKAIAMAQKINNDTLVGQAQFFTALNFHELNVDSAVYYNLEAYNRLKKYQHPWFIFALDNIFLYYVQKARYPEALQFSLEKLAYYLQANDTVNSIDASIDVGYLYDRNRDYDLALQWHKKSLQQAIDIKNDFLIAKSYGFMGIVFDELEQYDSAHYYNQKALVGFKKLEEWGRYRTWCSNIGNTYLKQKKWHDALYYLNLSLQDENLEESQNGIKFINLGKVYLELGALKKCEEYLNRGINNCLQHQQLKFLSEGYFHKSAYYTKLNKFDLALENYQLYKAYNDSVFSQEKLNQIAYMQVKFETEEKEKLLLEEQQKKQLAENKNLQLDLKLTARNNLLLLFAGLILTVLFVGYFWAQRNKKRLTAEKNKAIIEEKDKGLKAVITAQEEERTRVARELHDGIVQELTIIKNQLQKTIPLSSADVQPLLEKITNDLQISSKEVRNISHQLMPLALRELGLVAAVQDMLEKVLTPLHIKYDFEEIGMDERLPEKIEVSLYRIAQELTNNIIKHSGANQVTLTLNNRGGFITMIVEDNGHGFTTSEQKEGIGLSSINSRISLVHGELKYESSKESGTVTIVKIPLIENLV